MNKCIALSLLIMSPIFTHAMEDNSWRYFSSLRPYLPVWPSFNQMPQESKQIQALRASKSKFNNQLTALWMSHWNRTIYNPTTFWSYCYCPKDTSLIELNILKYLDSYPSVLKECQEDQIDGYSALGTTMMATNLSFFAKDISIEEKRNFIQELTNRGFKPTPKDIELAELILYDGIIGHQKIFLHLQHIHSQANWSVLPQEVRKQITQYMLQLFKKEFWLLPEKSLNDL